MVRASQLFILFFVFAGLGFSSYSVAGDLSSNDFVLHTGDFNHDGRLDLLHQARDPQDAHGIVLNNGNSEFTTQLQVWHNGHLGLNWDTNSYLLHTADFNQDGHTDVLLQATSNTPSLIVTANSTNFNTLGYLDNIASSWANNELGLSWNSRDSNLVTGDFNGDGKVEVLLQGRTRQSPHATINLDAAGGPSTILQQWSEDYLSHEWSGQTHKIHVGDFNGDGRADLFLQAKYQFIFVAVDDIQVPVPQLPDTMHAILLADANGQFTTVAQQWDNTHLGLNSAWMADNSNVVIADTNGDGRDEILLQGKSSSSTHYLLSVDVNGQITSISQSWQDGYLGQNWSGATTTILPGDFDGDGKADLVLHNETGVQNTVTSDTAGQFTSSSVIYTDITQPIIARKDKAFMTPTAFGATQGRFDVAYGSAGYSVPITVPPGIGGLQPSLSLDYNSGAQNGLLGVGWSVNGLGSISRCPQNYAQDANLDNISFDSNDRLCLDGERLIAVNGTYGAAGTEYRTEMESFSRITGMGGDFNSGTAWFKVEIKSGKIYEYGNSGSSRLLLTKGNGSQVTLSWAVNRITDAAGNYMTVDYQQSASTGEHYPLSINYTLNDKPGSELTTAGFKVQFEYESRNDMQKGYLGTAKVQTLVRLSGIKTVADTQIVRQYHLQYENDLNTGLSRVTHIVDCDVNESCKLAVAFEWQNGQRWPVEQQNTSLCTDAWFDCDAAGLWGGTGSNNRNSSRFLDINGDGYTDVCFRRYSGIHCAYGSKTGIDESTLFGTTICANDSTAYGGCGAQRNFDSIQYVDINADGKTDVTFRGEQGIQIVLSDGNTFSTHINTGIYPEETYYNESACIPPESCEINVLNDIHYPDLNGDAYPDICIRSPVPEGIKCYLNMHSGNFFNTTSEPGYDIPNCTLYVRVNCITNVVNTINFVDVNVDGKMDLVYREFSGISYRYSTGTGFSGQYDTSICSDGAYNCNDGDNYNTIRYPDINGDAVPDVCWRGDQGINCIPGTGQGFDESKIIATDICGNNSAYACNDSNNHQTIQYVDLNGDGKSDLTFRSDTGIRSFLSTGEDFVFQLQTDICRDSGDQYQCNSSDNNWFTISYPDINGDGLPDLAFRSDSGIRVHLSDGKQPNLITGITDGLGNQTTITYKPLTDSSVHTPCTDAAYPELCVNIPMPVVASYHASNGVGGMASYGYQYLGYRLHMRGRGPLGFVQINKADYQTGIITGTFYDNSTSATVRDAYPDTYPYLGMPIHNIAVLNNVVLSDTINTFSYHSTYQGLVVPYFPYIATSTEVNRDYDTDSTVIETITQNFFDEGQAHYAGNLTRVITTTTDKTSSLDTYTDKVFTKTMVNVYSDIIDADTWQLGRLTGTTVTHTTDSDTVVRTSSISYTADGLITETREEPGNPDLELITSYDYDAYGKKIQITHAGNPNAAFPVEARTSTTGYVAGTVNTLSQQIVSSNALGHGETKLIDARFGVTTSLTGPNGLTTQWQYDGFGRTLKEIRADGTSTEIIREVCDGQCLPVGTIVPAYRIINRTDGQADRIAYFDTLKRKIRIESVSVDGRKVYQDTVYDNLGRVSKTSQPYFGGDTVYWTHYDYDALSRPVSETLDGSGLVKTINYAPLSVTTVANNPSGLNSGNVRTHVKTSYNYANGKLRKVEENKSDTETVILTYQYDATGNLLQVNAPNSPPVVMDYDKKGRKISMSDPDMGSWIYAYDVFGNLRRQVDALGQQVDILYDKLGRKVLRIEAEGASIWQYDTAANMGIGKLHSMIGPIPLNSSQLAAQRANPSVADALAASTPNDFSRSYSYDSLGRPSTTLTLIDNIPFEFATGYDSYGRVLTTTYPENLGSNQRLTLHNVYDSNGFLLRLENAANNAVFWQLGDSSGNVAGASNARGQITIQSYGNGLSTYKVFNPADGMLETITTGTNGQVQNLAYVFDSIGNLEQRQDNNQQFNGQPVTEVFSYDHLNRLKTITLNGLQTRQFDYDDNGNIVYNSGFGTYSYTGASGPHAVDDVLDANSQVINHYTYDANGNMTGDNDRAISWTSYNKPRMITKGSETVSFLYAADRARYKQIKSDGEVIYLGKQFERETTGTTTKDTHYISAGGQLIGSYTVTQTNTIQTRYFHHDHLGSIDVVTDGQGNVVERMSFSAFGQRRNLDWSYSSIQLFATETHRGYTGHEQFDSVGLIHMNGRIYDPQLGRFLSPDPFIQAASNSQNYNRYTYVNNNPLSYTDQTGYFGISLSDLWDATKEIFYDVAEVGWKIWKYATPSGWIMYSNPVKKLFKKHEWARKLGLYAATFYGNAYGAAAFQAYLVDIYGGSINEMAKTFVATYVFAWLTNGDQRTEFGAAAFIKYSAKRYLNEKLQNNVDRYARSHLGISGTEFNLGLLGLSYLGNEIAGSRVILDDADLLGDIGLDVSISGWLSRDSAENGGFWGKVMSGFFDAVDSILAYQGLSTASSIEARKYIGLDIDGSIEGHSLGSIDVNNLTANGFVSHSTVYSLPFGNVGAGGTTVYLGSLDPINVGTGGLMFTPDANVVWMDWIGHGRIEVYGTPF